MEDYLQRIKRDLKYFPYCKLNYYKEENQSFYVEKNSNKQISSFYKVYQEDKPNYVYKLYSLLILFNMYYNMDPENIIKILKKKDDFIYEQLINSGYKKAKYFMLAPQMRACIIKNSKRFIKNYLDVGCMDGNKTYNSALKMGIKQQNIYCLNLEEDEIFEAQNTTKKITIKTYKKEDKFPFKDKFFSLVSFDMVMHHVEDIEHVLKETYRVLEKDGQLLIRDHDITNDFEKTLCDIQHIIMAKKKNRDYINCNDYSKYFSWPELNYIITSNGFVLKKYMKDNAIASNIENVTRSYYCLYQKI